MTLYWEREEHRIFRNAFRCYLQREIIPYLKVWDEVKMIPRQAWLALGKQGYLCPSVPEEYGGIGVGFEYSVIINEELGRCGALNFFVGLHSDIVAPYIISFGTHEQKQRYLPGTVSGELILAIAMSEPDTGSNLADIRTTAVKDGNYWVLNGQKTFISNGICCDVVIVAAKTDCYIRPAYKGISLFIIEHGTKGFQKGRKLEKMGLHGQDTAEMFFTDCRVPIKNLLGQEGDGFIYLMQKLQQERLVCSVLAQGAAEYMLELALIFAKTRYVFGVSIGSLQHNSFKLAEMATEVEIGRAFLDRVVIHHLEGKNIVKQVSMAKWWITEMANRIAYHSVQLHGGYGYMEEYPICSAFRNIRAHTLYAGTTEIMKLIIAKQLDL